MNVIVAQPLNIRYGAPEVQADNLVTNYDPGEAVPVSGVVEGQAINGNNKWYKVDGLNYYIWSGGCFNTNVTPTAPLDGITLWGEMIQTAYLMYEKDKTQVQPNTDNCSLPTGWALDTWLTVEATATTPRYVAVKEFFGFSATDAQGNRVIVFRGTDSCIDWITDVEIKPENDSDMGGKVERGFDETVKSMKAIKADKSVQPFADWVKALDKNGKYIVTGHSLGASIATIAAASLATNGIAGIKVYLFATPKTGDPTFVANFNKAIPACEVIDNIPDLVPKVPPTLPPFINYGDVGQTYRIDSRTNSSIKQDILCFHSILTYLYMLGSTKFRLADKCKV
jgi:hypothetical protein